MHCKNKFPFNCMNFKFLLDASYRQSFILRSGIRGTHCAQNFIINKCLHATEPVPMPTVSAISCTLTRRFCSTVCSTARQFSSQAASDGRPNRAYLHCFFCLGETQLPSTWDGIWWHIFSVNNNHSIGYLLWLNVLQCQKFCNCITAGFIKISHTAQSAFFTILDLAK